MTLRHGINTIDRWLAISFIILLAGVVAAGRAEAAPVKLKLESHVGWEVDETTKGKICTVVSGDKCRPGLESGEPGGFVAPRSAAVQSDPSSSSHGDVYVVDKGNERVQELTANGQFVRSFGGSGSAAGQFDNPQSIAVDPATGNVYVQDLGNWRVQEFTDTGEFILMFGKDVNKNKSNVCVKKEEQECKSGVEETAGSAEAGAFNFLGNGDMLAVGQGDVVYVGDEHRVQEFHENGTPAGEVPLTSINSAPGSKVAALAVNEAGDAYVVYPQNADVVREMKPNGAQLLEIPVSVNSPKGAIGEITSLALDFNGHLAVGAFEEGEVHRWFGSLYEAGTSHLITEFTGPGPFVGMTFGVQNELYAAVAFSFSFGTGHELLIYKPVPVAELKVQKQGCTPGAEHETDETVDCVFHGTVNPEGVPGTEVSFQWGNTCSFGRVTPTQGPFSGNAPIAVEATIEGLRPNGAEFCYQLAGNDENVPKSSGETLTSLEQVSFTTPIVPPKLLGAPSVSFVKPSSAVMSGELNPENARTEYLFEYGTGAALAECGGGVIAGSCSGVTATPVEESACPKTKEGVRCVYGPLGVTLEASGLQPATSYHYRLAAKDVNLAETETLSSVGPESEFTTAAAPQPLAVTGGFGALSATSATISGTVDPDGLPATYAFEVGVYAGAATQYGIVFSGPAGAGTSPIEKTLTLTGLQPGTTYSYRIALSSGYVKGESHTVRGAPATFTTLGLPSVLPIATVLPQLPIPPIAFPKATGSTTPKKLTRAQQLASALKACAKRPKSRRATCRRSARRRYAPAKKATRRTTGRLS